MESFFSAGELFFKLHSIAIKQKSAAPYILAAICKIIGNQAIIFKTPH